MSRHLAAGLRGIVCQVGRGSSSARSSLLHTTASAQGPSPEAREALEGFHARYSSSTEPTTHLHQTIDSNQVHLARLTLSSMLPLHANEEDILSRGKVSQKGLPKGTLLIPSEHLCFFTPRVSQNLLGKDGSDTSFNPPGGIFTRRMWAGGEMIFEKDNQLKIGDESWEKTFVEEANWKELKNGRGEMIVVWVKKIIGNEKGICLTDRRSWIFQPKLKDTSNTLSSSTDSFRHDSDGGDAPSIITSPTKLSQDASQLFRYSALTFNAHAIHLSPPWAQQVEGHPNIVVHGPLNLSLLLRKWGRDKGDWSVDDQGQFVIGQSGKKVRSVKYRALKPIHANHTYWLGFPSKDTEGSGDKVLAVKTDGQIAMEASMTAW